MTEVAKEAVNNFRQIFLTFDTGQSGILDHSELKEMMICFGHENITDDEVTLLIRRYDRSGTGGINFHEFVNLVTEELDSKSYEVNSKDIFQTLSGNMSEITIDYMYKTMRRLRINLTQEEVEIMIEAADSHRDGFVDYGEFLLILEESGYLTLPKDALLKASRLDDTVLEADSDAAAAGTGAGADNK